MTPVLSMKIVRGWNEVHDSNLLYLVYFLHLATKFVTYCCVGPRLLNSVWTFLLILLGSERSKWLNDY